MFVFRRYTVVVLVLLCVGALFFRSCGREPVHVQHFVGHDAPLQHEDPLVCKGNVCRMQCSASIGWGNAVGNGTFPSWADAVAVGGGDVPGISIGTKLTGPPKLKTVVVIGKGTTSRPVEKTPNVLIVTVNHALAWQNHSDIHFQLDYYFEQVPLDFFCRARALVMPTYFHYQGSKHIHASVLLSRLNYDGPVFLVQLPDSPVIDPKIRTWSGSEAVHSSGDLAFAWMLDQGYRQFESYGIGGSGYADYYVSDAYEAPPRFVQSAAAHDKQIRTRMDRYGASWTRH